MRPPALLLAIVALTASACSKSSNPAADGNPGHGDGGSGQGSDAGDCSCTTAPDPVCVDAMTLQSSRAPGTCNAATHTCDFETSTSTCPFGCAGGACQAQACTPLCAATACVDDGCGGSCGPCVSGTTYPGVTATTLGIADDAILAPDGIHIAAIRALQPLSPTCGFNPAKVGTLDVWTVPATGAATHRTVGAHVPLYSATFTDDGYLLYNDNSDPCTGRGELWIAHADGSQPHLVAASVLIGVQLAGHTAFYSAPDPTDPDTSTFDGFVYAAALPDGAPVQLASIRYDSYWAPSPDGSAIWVDYQMNAGDLSIQRTDGSSTLLTSANERMLFYPTWSPAGDKLAYPLSTASGIALHVVDTAGTNNVTADPDCAACGDFNAIAWSSDGARVAWLVRPPAFGLDAKVRTIAGGTTTTLTGVVSPTTGGQVFRFTFSNDNARLYAAAGSDQNGWSLMSGTVGANGAMSALVPSLASDGDQFNTSWTESPTGTVLAAMGGDTTTKVVTIGGATTSIAGSVSEQPKLEPIASAPRWLIAHGTNVLSIFPTNGSGAGTALTGYASTYNLSEYAFSGYIPFVFGWAGSTALFASNPAGSYPKMTEDLMATKAATTGRLGSLVTHFRVGATPPRVVFTTSGGALLALPLP